MDRKSELELYRRREGQRSSKQAKERGRVMDKESERQEKWGERDMMLSRKLLVRLSDS